MGMTLTFDQIMEVEDSLQEAGVFYNGIRGKGHTCHSDSYMTCVDFEELDKWMARKLFKVKQLEYCVEYWKTNPNMQPPLRIVASTVARNLNKVSEKI
jgi:hypothetical protein